MEPRNRKVIVYQPTQLWLAAVVAVLLLASAGYLLFQRGMAYAVTEFERLGQRHAQLVQALEAERAKTSGLRQQLANQERASDIDRQASLQVRDEFAALESKLLAARKELAFYRGIVAPSDNKTGLNIQRFDLEPGAADGRYRYKLMLTQVKRNDRYARGSVDIDIDGIRDGKHEVLSFTGLQVDGSAPLKFKFRYFQDFDGEIVVPKEFEPQRLTIRVKPSGKGQPAGIEKTMEWPV
jgi:hypothetical protein